MFSKQKPEIFYDRKRRKYETPNHERKKNNKNDDKKFDEFYDVNFFFFTNFYLHLNITLESFNFNNDLDNVQNK